MTKAIPILLSCLLWLGAAGDAAAQGSGLLDVPEEKGAGELSVTYQSFYNHINGNTIANVGGTAVSFRHFFPEHGLLNLRLEPLADRGSFAAGENYAQWKGLPWKGRHWDFALGDFRVNTALQPMPFTNLTQPDLSLRGGSVTARGDNWRYSFYGGFETLSQGPRIPFRERVPQSAIGMEAAGEPLERVKLGLRYLHLGSSRTDVAGQNHFFPLSRQFSRSDSLTAQTSVNLAEGLNWYTEAGWNSAGSLRSASAPPHSSFSLVSGPAWDTSRFTLRANYMRQGVGYLPVLGYFLGDRRGPNVDGVFHLGRLDFSGSWSQSRNNLERDREVPDFFSRQASGGINARLPFNFALSASLSQIDLETRSAGLPPQSSDNRQFHLTLSRPLFGHNLRASFQQLDIQLRDSSQRLHFLELEDTYRWGRFTLGGAVRWQRSASAHLKNSLFFRSSIQAQFPRFNIYSYLEQGKDLATTTLFATNTFSTSLVGISWNAPQGMAVQVEAFRNNVNSNVNPGSAFVLSSRGVPLDTTLARFHNWSLYVRATRSLSWGERLSVDARGEVQRQAPITGTLAGFVELQTMEGDFGAPDVLVAVDSGRTVKTDANGYFEIPEIPQGTHTVSLNLDRLPADLNPTEQSQLSVVVQAEQTTRAQLAVIPLQTLPGAVLDIHGKPAPEGVVIRLSPSGQYTTTDKLGHFGFYNLPEGDYVVTLEEKSLPEHARAVTPAQVPVKVRYRTAKPLEANFAYETVLPGPKPLERVLQGEREVVVAPAEPSLPPDNAAKAKETPAKSASVESEKPKESAGKKAAKPEDFRSKKETATPLQTAMARPPIAPDR